MSAHVPLLRRRKAGMTDYRARRKAITSQRPLLVVRISNRSVSAQFVKPAVRGDLVLSSAHSRELASLGWHGSQKSTPACYLLGLLAGKKAIKAGLKEAIVYNGLVPFIRGSRISALVKGVTESGVAVPAGEDAFPDDERLTGRSIAGYASKLAADDKAAYTRAFSGLIRAGFNPENYASEFEKAKSAITKGRK